MPWRKGPAHDVGPQQLHVYFPTDDSLGRAVLVHGDFYVHSSRRHIEHRGPGGQISRLVAERAASLIGELAESLVEYGAKLLSCLAENEPASGFGSVVADAIDARLTDARIARPADGAAAKRPGQLRRLALASTRQEQRLIPILSPRGDLLRPGDDEGPAGDLLECLGTKDLSWKEIAERIELHRSGLGPRLALATLARWVQGLDEDARDVVVHVLRKRPLLLDVAGRWRPPEKLIIRGPEIPPLPSGLQTGELDPPTDPTIRRLVKHLKVEELTLRAAVDKVVGTASTLTRDGERKAVHDFLRAAWDVDTKAFEGRPARFNAIPVPARSLRGRSRAWRRASEVYFTSQWTSNRLAERLYGALGRAEFLAVPCPRDGGAARHAQGFYRRLGVAGSPRVLQFTGTDDTWSWRRPLKSFGDWEDVEPVQAALQCSEGHPQTARHFSMPVLDRLDELLERRSRETSSLLAALLADSSHPYGTDAEIYCRHSAHTGRAHHKHAPGYQRWRLKSTAWIPVRNDPAGVDLRPPPQVWTGTRLPQWLLVPQARLPPSVGRALRLVNADRPGLAALEESLLRLRDAFPDLANAPPDVQRSAEWLLKHLNRASQRADASPCPPLPASRGGEPVWSDAPVVGDEAAASLLDELDLLPTGSWSGLRHRYGLRRASEVVESQVRPGKRMRGRPLVVGEQGASLLAYLGARGADQDRLATRLASLRERAVATVELALRATGTQPWNSVARPYVLDLERDRLSRIRGATLFWAPPLEGNARIDLARDLAAYLDATEYGDAIALFLLAQPAALDSEHISDDDVAEAARQVRTHRRGRDGDPRDDLDDLLDDDGDDGDASADEAADEDNQEAGDGADSSSEHNASEADADDEGDRADDNGTGDAALPPINHDAVAAYDVTPEGEASDAGDDEGTKKRRRFGGGGGGGTTDWAKLERDRRLYGHRGEDAAYQNERRRVESLGYDPDVVQWVSRDDETSSYDIRSVDDDGGPRYIEVKATTSENPADPFPISTAELRFALHHRERHFIYRVTSVKSAAPEIFRCRDAVSALEQELATLRMSRAVMSLPFAANEHGSR